MFNMKKKASATDAAGENAASADGGGEADVSATRRTGPGSGPPKPMFTIKPSKKTCIVLASLMGGTLIASGGLYAWQSGQIAETEKQVMDKQKQVADGEKITQRLQVVEASYGQTQQQLRYLETSVTANEYVPTLLRQMETLAKNTNLKVAAVRPTMEPAPKMPADKEARKNFKTWPYDKIHVDMDVSGGYWDVAKMLYQLTEFPKIMSVEAVQVTPENRPLGPNGVPVAGPPNLNVKLKLTGFIFPSDGVPHVLPPGLPSVSPGAVPPPSLPAASQPSAAAAPPRSVSSPVSPLVSAPAAASAAPHL